MDVLLVRHAIALPRDIQRWPEDELRPLSPRGVQRGRKAAAGLKRLIKRPQRVLTSPWVRARQTAALLADSADWPRPIACAELAPGRPTEAVLALLRREPEKLIALVGHQPDLGELIALALPGDAPPDAFELKRFSVALLSFRGEARANSATLSWLLPPRVLRSLQ
jgi:phosphohistidine phosphatase